MQISLSTLYEWKKKYPQISEALKKGKEVADRFVENALYMRAVGIEKKITKPVKIKEATYRNGKKVSEKESIAYVEETIYYPPDVTAIIYWLKNRKPAVWRERPEAEPSAQYESDGFLEALRGELKLLEGDAVETESII